MMKSTQDSLEEQPKLKNLSRIKWLKVPLVTQKVILKFKEYFLIKVFK